ncbi:MAG: lysophospholipid acyltransferase family protein [Moraxellaceae bacterium]|nr:lysophospholipid acyltransferase family protein [Moraxellaceae bacterium]
MFRRHVLPAIVFVFYRLLRMTWRVTFDECPAFRRALDNHDPVVIAHWHGDELGLIHLVRRYRIATITSTSKDGELMNRVLVWLGAATARGSSTRGGANAMRGLISHCRKNGNNVSFAVDGPKGPIHKVKPGVFEFSRLMQAPIFVASIGISRPWVFHRSWNKAVLPKPFSRVHVRIAEGMPVITRDQDAREVALAAQLEQMLHEGQGIAAGAVS